MRAGAEEGDGRIEVAVVQMEAHPGAVDTNRQRLESLVRGLEGPVDLVVAPELASTGYDLDLLAASGRDLAEGPDGPTVALAAGLAREIGAVIVAGFLEGDGGRLYDAAVVAGPDGERVRYRKTHLYPPERKCFTPGERLVTVATPAARLGMMICFEHAFPEIATALALEGAQVLAVPSAVPNGYEHLLELRTRARAQDNQVFVVASNLVGGGFCGRSLVVDPRGEVLAMAGDGEAVIRATLDLATIPREREREPALRLRRPDLYRLDRALVARDKDPR